MMQMNHIQQQFLHLEQTIHQMTQACRLSPGMPSELKQCINELDWQTDEALQIVQTQDERRIRECVQDLEELGDRAKRSCESAEQIDEGLRDAIMQAHSELSDLKRQLH